MLLLYEMPISYGQFSWVDDGESFESKLQQRSALLEHLDPDSVVISESNRALVRLEHGFGGLFTARYRQGDDWWPVLELVSKLVPLAGGESLELLDESHDDRSKDTIYRFAQKIDGITVDAAILNIQVEEATGCITEVYSSLVPDNDLPRANLGAVEAVNIVKRYESERGTDSFSYSEPKLAYFRVPNSDRVELLWRFYAFNHQVFVNAVDGTLKVFAY